jgi:aspartate-semialdehyde dehydrogenase
LNTVQCCAFTNTAAEATEILSKASGVTVMDKREDGGYATPFVEATNHDDTFVSRIRVITSITKAPTTVA